MTLVDYYVQLTALQKQVPGLKTVVAQLSDVLARLMLIQNASNSFLSGKSSVIQFPFAEVQVTLDKIEALAEAAESVLDVPWGLLVTLSDVSRELRNTQFVKEIFSSQARTTEAVANVFDTSAKSRKAYTVQWGDTLRGIAQRFLNDQTRWMELVSLNNLTYPYIVNTAEEAQSGNVAIPGTVITLPLDAQDSASQVISKNPADYESLFGRDIYLKGGYLQFDSLDLMTVAGADNLVQALQMRLMTPVGQLPLHPDYGSSLEIYIGLQGGQTEMAMVALEVQRTMRMEPRINSIRTIDVTFDSTAILATATAFVIGADTPQSLNLVIGK